MSGENAFPILTGWRRWLLPQWHLSKQSSWDSLDEEETVDLGAGWALQVDWLGHSFMLWYGRLTGAPKGSNQGQEAA